MSRMRSLNLSWMSQGLQVSHLVNLREHNRKEWGGYSHRPFAVSSGTK